MKLISNVRDGFSKQTRSFTIFLRTFQQPWYPEWRLPMATASTINEPFAWYSFVALTNIRYHNVLKTFFWNILKRFNSINLFSVSVYYLVSQTITKTTRRPFKKTSPDKLRKMSGVLWTNIPSKRNNNWKYSIHIHKI